MKGAVGALQSRFSAIFSNFAQDKSAPSTQPGGDSAGSDAGPGSAAPGADSDAKAVAAAVTERCGLRLQSGWSGEYEGMLPAGATLFAAQQFMVEGGVSVACVGRVDNSAALGGVITEGDIVKAIARYSQNNDFLQQHAIAHMTTAQHVRTIPSNTSVGDALQLMLSGRFRHLPMLDSGSGRVMMNISVLQLSRQLLGVAALAQPEAPLHPLKGSDTGAAKGMLSPGAAADEIEDDDAPVAPFTAAPRGGGAPASPPPPAHGTAAASTVLSPTPARTSATSSSVVGGQSASTRQGGHAAELTVAPEFHRRFAAVHNALAQAAQLRAAGSHARVVATITKALRNLSRLSASTARAAAGGGSLDLATARVACTATHVRALQMQAFAWKMLGLTGTDAAVASVGIASVSNTSDALHAADASVQDALEALGGYADSVTQCMHFGASLTPGGTLLLVPADEGGAAGASTPPRGAGAASTATGVGTGVPVPLIAEHLDVFLSLMRAEICVFTAQYSRAAGLVGGCLGTVRDRLPQHATATTALSRGHARQYIASIISDMVDEAADVCDVASEATGAAAVTRRAAGDTRALVAATTAGGGMDPTAAQFASPSAAQAAQAATACVRAAQTLTEACRDWLVAAPPGVALCDKAAALQAPDATMAHTAWSSVAKWLSTAAAADGRGCCDAAAAALGEALSLAPRRSAAAAAVNAAGGGSNMPLSSALESGGVQLPCLLSSWQGAQNAVALGMCDPALFAAAALLAATAAAVCCGAEQEDAAAVWKLRAMGSCGAGLHACALRSGGLHGAAAAAPAGDEDCAVDAGKWAALLRAVQDALVFMCGSSSGAAGLQPSDGAAKLADAPNGDEAAATATAAQADLDELAALLAAHDE